MQNQATRKRTFDVTIQMIVDADSSSLVEERLKATIPLGGWDEGIDIVDVWWEIEEQVDEHDDAKHPWRP
jgi:hypothetical protein